MIREIGSTFWINPNTDYSKRFNLTPDSFHLKGDDWFFLSTGRSCIKLAIETAIKRKAIKTRIAVVPSFTCHTCTLPFEINDFQIVPLPVSKDLTVAPEILKSTVIQSNASIVLLHQYFGFETMKSVESVIKELRNQGVVFIEDRTQCLYSDFSPLPVDYYVASIRKWDGLPDGGVVVSTDGCFKTKVSRRNVEFERIKLQASIEKYHYIIDGKGDKEHFRFLYETAANVLASEEDYYLINNSSTCVQHDLDINRLKKTRRDNYEYLFKLLRNQSLFEPIFNPSNYEVPLYFPLKTQGYREKLQRYLASKSIYAPVIWPNEVSFIVDDVTSYLYEDLLCIPVDQRYGLNDMERIAREIIFFARGI